MNALSVFISSVQKEFEAERATLRDYLQADPLCGAFSMCSCLNTCLPETDR